MKKVFLALAVIATVACFSSCNKTCTCKTYVAGVATESEVSLDDLKKDNENIKKCSDVNTVVEVMGVQAGMVCE